MIEALKDLEKPDTPEFHFDSNAKILRKTIIDFLFRIKDKLPFNDAKNDYIIDGLKIIMEFMFENSYKPSAALLKEYSESKITRELNTLPPLEYLNSKFKKYAQMSKVAYERLRKRLESRPPFVFYFNPNIQKQEKACSGWRLKIGFFAEGKDVSVNKWNRLHV